MEMPGVIELLHRPYSEVRESILFLEEHFRVSPDLRFQQGIGFVEKHQVYLPLLQTCRQLRRQIQMIVQIGHFFRTLGLNRNIHVALGGGPVRGVRAEQKHQRKMVATRNLFERAPLFGRAMFYIYDHCLLIWQVGWRNPQSAILNQNCAGSINGSPGTRLSV